MSVPLGALYHWSPVRFRTDILRNGLVVMRPRQDDPGYQGFPWICFGTTPSSAWGRARCRAGGVLRRAHEGPARSSDPGAACGAGRARAAAADAGGSARAAGGDCGPPTSVARVRANPKNRVVIIDSCYQKKTERPPLTSVFMDVFSSPSTSIR